MSTNIPPHNLLELSSAVIELIRNPEMSLDEIMKFLPAPDFPTGGIILEKEKIKDIYEKGEGTIYVRAKTEIISSKNDGKKDLILVKELPYKVNKGNLVSSISQIIREKKIEGLKSISDYSSYEETVNIHIKFDHNYDGNIILNQLCKKTLLQSTFSVKMRALVDNKPKIFPIKNILEEFIVQRSNNIRKKSIFIHSRNDKELSNLETKKFIVENYSEIIEIIKNSTGSEERMKEGFKDRFDLDEESIIKVLDTPSSFRQFTPERREKLKREIESLKLNNELQRKLIDNESERRLALVEELEDLKKNYYKDFRKTFLTSISHSITERELIPHENRVVVFGIYENKKEKKVLNFFTNYQVDNFDGTNIPSVGKELKSRGDS
jgi:DNA gyrase subunit A